MMHGFGYRIKSKASWSPQILWLYWVSVEVGAVLYCLTTYQVSVSSLVCRWVSCVSHHCCLISFGAVTDWLICHDLVAEDLFLLFPVDDIHSAEEFKSVGTHFTTFCCQKCHAVLVLFSFLVSAKMFMFVRMRNSIVRSVSLFYFPPSSLFFVT